MRDPQPHEDETEVVTDGAHDGVDLIAKAALEEVSAPVALGFAVSDHGFDGGSRPRFLLHTTVNAAFLAGFGDRQGPGGDGRGGGVAMYAAPYGTRFAVNSSVEFAMTAPGLERAPVDDMLAFHMARSAADRAAKKVALGKSYCARGCFRKNECTPLPLNGKTAPALFFRVAERAGG